MKSSLLKEALWSLCVEIGWTYAVFWRAIGFGDQMYLVWEDGHCERTSGSQATSRSEAMDLLIKENRVLQSSNNGGAPVEVRCQTEYRVENLVYKLLAAQVHMVGDGLVGRAAFTGNHEWILANMLNGNASISKGLAEISHQLLAGIQTIAIIPVLPHGVVQFGSSQMVVENIRFINHVKGLFEQLERVSGALSDTTQNSLNQSAHLRASSGMQTSLSQFGVGTDTNNLLSNGNIDNCLSKDSNLRALNELSFAFSTELNNKMAANSPFAKENITGTMAPLSSFPQPDHTIVTPIDRFNSQCESEHQGPQVIFSSQDMRLIENVLPYDSHSRSRYHHPSDILPSSRLTFLKEQLFSTFDIKSRDLAGNHEANLSNNMLQSHSNECTVLASPQVSDVISSFNGIKYLNSMKDLRAFNSFSSGTPCVDSSVLEVPGVVNSVGYSPCKQMFSRESEPSNATYVCKESQTLFSSENYKKGGGVLQVPPSSSSIFGEHNPCYESLCGNLQDGSVQKASVAYSTFTSTYRNGNKDHKMLEDEKASLSSRQSLVENDLFDLLCLDHNRSGCHGNSLDDAVLNGTDANAHELSTDVSTCRKEIERGPIIDTSHDEIHCSGMLSESASDQLLDAVVSQIKPGAKQVMDTNASCKTSLTEISSSSVHMSSSTFCWMPPLRHIHGESFHVPPTYVMSEPAASNSGKSSCSVERNEGCFSQTNGAYKSQVNLWIQNGQNMNCDNMSAAHCKRVEEVGKLNRKRSRPGESPRPRPKDRQMIQDRVKELREIVPNGAKCSIDALLEKTIKHMLFLQSVTKHVDKLKETGKPKIICKEGGLLLKDNFEGGATWAFEFGCQSMICPIVVEDLNPPRQMLVEMLCEEKGLFLEIADLVRGLGLTILKGVLEVRKDKVWARFAVEACRDVTRMEIFLSLMRLLEPSARSSKAPEGVENLKSYHMVPAPSVHATGLTDHLF